MELVSTSAVQNEILPDLPAEAMQDSLLRLSRLRKASNSDASDAMRKASLWRRLDGLLPWPSTSIIGIGAKRPDHVAMQPAYAVKQNVSGRRFD